MEIIFHPAFPIFYARGRVVEDLALGRETIELRPEGHPNRSTSLTMLQLISPPGTSNSGARRTSTRPLLSAEKPSIISRKDNPTGQHH
ncbi:hypothetical protein L210DRAFT_2476129 [Boletus edulis BED1]|uniref:Uncharacterized protein n=1 Tax=Boletus edulis BED1 TaxID=1328754 RepID=A0AAD4BPN0_BOLED|nr:hypothetical protein L210DRAFT_2476129 [Boletus edulis BED1]